DLIKIIRADFPEIKIFAGFDPYRSSIKQERQYIEKKFNAGVDAILSQPFFDMRLLEIYSEFIPSDKVYWGISPVVTDKSKAYWEKMNHAIFPADYQATYDWNIETAKRILEFATDQGSHVYFMPIRINLESYFLPLLDMARKLIGNTKT
ncbi:MAG: methylenetetrahydrofolate reductase, partial [Gammaproteobacteria bacterium]|nr:methylenetetrahydrofolate reductase [Gammaproteobacteria bacterium]